MIITENMQRTIAHRRNRIKINEWHSKSAGKKNSFMNDWFTSWTSNGCILKFNCMFERRQFAKKKTITHVCVCVDVWACMLSQCVCISITTLKQHKCTNRQNWHQTKWELNGWNGYVPHERPYFLLSPFPDYDWPPRMRPGSVNGAPVVPSPHYCPVDSIAMCRPISNLDRWTHDLPCSVSEKRIKFKWTSESQWKCAGLGD